MKKTLTVNLNGRVFTIDEDAYELLDEYIRNLKIYFRTEDGFLEIIADFEGRIGELFSERIRLGYEVISIEQVEEVIQKVGKPEDFGDINSPESFEEEKKDEASKASNGDKKTKKRLHRNIDNKLAGGVFSGIAAYFELDETPVRLAGLLLLLGLTMAYGGGILLYLILWIIIPPAKTAQQKLEMRGEEVSIENIGKVVSGGTAGYEKSNKGGCLGGILDFFASLLKVLLIGFGILIGLPLAFGLIILLIVVFAIVLGIGGGLIALPFGIAGIELGSLTLAHPTLTLVASILVAGIPLASLIYWIVARIATLSPMPKSMKITGIVVWIIAVIVLITSGLQIKWNEDGTNRHRNYWRISWSESKIKGNGILKNDTVILLNPFDQVKLDEKLIANIRLEQSASKLGKMVIECDSNLIEHIKYSVDDGRLRIYNTSNTVLESLNDITITVSSPKWSGVKIESIGRINIPGKIESDHFSIEIDGAGHVQADSLFCNQFRGSVEGIGILKVAGKANRSDLKLEGAGSINSLDLESDDVLAALEGIGKIDCNPVKSLDARVQGIGKITYKNEPPVKRTKIDGMGHIGR